ncbi:hypothetical protein Bbelb_200150 [Branchiostoma belcheri]|nr:hypothetical protein Bbelb_200150 [Branchiostoma belcheri]
MSSFAVGNVRSRSGYDRRAFATGQQRRRAEKEEMLVLRIDGTHQKRLHKEVEMRTQARVKIGQGPLTSQLDQLLQQFRVKRQAFHSQSFIGNHCSNPAQQNPAQQNPAQQNPAQQNPA